MPEIRLNLGCGINTIAGFVNIDVWPDARPDLVVDFSKNSLPFPDSSVSEVVMFHTIEHIDERLHDFVLAEIYRVMHYGAELMMSYPEFLTCSKNYEINYRGQRDFWKQTIYGRGSQPNDRHVALMDSKFFKNKLRNAGFQDLFFTCEPEADYNTVVKCSKGSRFNSREEVLNREIFGK